MKDVTNTLSATKFTHACQDVNLLEIPAVHSTGQLYIYFRKSNCPGLASCQQYNQKESILKTLVGKYT